MVKALKILAGDVQFLALGVFRFYQTGRFYGRSLGEFLRLAEQEAQTRPFVLVSMAAIKDTDLVFLNKKMSGEIFDCHYGYARLDERNSRIEKIGIFFHGPHGYLTATFHNGLVREWRLNGRYRLPRTTTRYERWALKQIRTILRDAAETSSAAHEKS